MFLFVWTWEQNSYIYFFMQMPSEKNEYHFTYFLWLINCLHLINNKVRLGLWFHVCLSPT